MAIIHLFTFSLFARTRREREMGIAVVSVQPPHHLLSFEISHSKTTRFHGSTTLKIHPFSKSLNLLSSSSSRCSASVVEEGPPRPPPDDSLAVQSDSAIDDSAKLPFRYCHCQYFLKQKDIPTIGNWVLSFLVTTLEI